MRNDLGVSRLLLPAGIALIVAGCVGGTIEPGDGTGGVGASAGSGGLAGTPPVAGSAGVAAGSGGATGGAGAMAGGAAGSVSGSGGAGALTGGSSGAAGIGGTAGAAGAALGGAGGGAGGLAGGAAGAMGGAAGALGGMGGSAAGTAGAGGMPELEPWQVAWFDENFGCVNCHGENGEGLDGKGPQIWHPNRELFDFLVRNGDSMPLARFMDGMDPVDQAMMSDEILDQIFAWLSAMPKPTTGAELFADYCSYCHGLDGRGGGATVAYVSANHSSPYDFSGAEFLKHVRDGHLSEGGSPVNASNRTTWMPPIPASVLTDQEVQLIEAFLPKQ